MQAISICFSNLWSVTIALLSCLSDFEHPSATDPLQTEAWARMFYVPSTPWTIVLPINHILYRVPLMRLFFGRIRCADHPPFFREGKGPIFSVRMRRSARAQECRIWQQFVRAHCASVAVCSPTTEDHVCQRALRKAPGGGPGCAY